MDILRCINNPRLGGWEIFFEIAWQWWIKNLKGIYHNSLNKPLDLYKASILILYSDHIIYKS